MAGDITKKTTQVLCLELRLNRMLPADRQDAKFIEALAAELARRKQPALTSISAG